MELVEEQQTFGQVSLTRHADTPGELLEVDCMKAFLVQQLAIRTSNVFQLLVANTKRERVCVCVQRILVNSWWLTRNSVAWNIPSADGRAET